MAVLSKLEEAYVAGLGQSLLHWKAKAEAAEGERDDWRAFALALDTLNVAYRTGRRPSGKAIDTASALREKLGQ